MEKVKTGWLPIESAPRDGTRILAYEDGNHYALEWCQEFPEPDGGYWKCFCGQYVTITPEPTHWMPLPAPPE
jgi:hypothetical protein